MTLRDAFSRHTWLYTVVGSVLLWLAISIITGTYSLSSIIANGVSAAILCIPSLGQMIVVTTGRGAIDLSIPSVITLSAFLSTGIADGRNSHLPLAVLAVLAVTVAVGLINAFLVLLLRIPAIIATIAMGYILTTACLIYNRYYTAVSIPTALTAIIRNRILGIPYSLIFTAVLIAVTAWLLKRTRYGLTLSAVGQNLEAAYLAGLRVNRVQVVAAVWCSMLAGLAGILIATRVGGAFLGMGDSYMMETVGSVVIGGTLIFGGKATAVGTYFGALFLGLVGTAMYIAGLPIGGQNIIKGVIIVAVLLLANKPVE
jgi:ribose transport system permease protein